MLNCLVYKKIFLQRKNIHGFKQKGFKGNQRKGWGNVTQVVECLLIYPNPCV